MLKNKDTQIKINDLVLEANKKRYETYVLEQKAIKMVNEKVTRILTIFTKIFGKSLFN